MYSEQHYKCKHFHELNSKTFSMYTKCLLSNIFHKS